MSGEDEKDTLNLLGLNKLFDEFVDQYAKLELDDI
jgi:choline kinase